MHEFVYATLYVLSILSYQIAEVNEMGIPVKELKKKVDEIILLNLNIISGKN